jgi:hypothetical protein
VNPQTLPATARPAVHGKTPYDACFLDSGFPRAHYERVFAELAGRSLATLAEAVQRRAEHALFEVFVAAAGDALLGTAERRRRGEPATR